MQTLNRTFAVGGLDSSRLATLQIPQNKTEHGESVNDFVPTRHF